MTEPFNRLSARVRGLGRQAATALFGDRRGLVLFLGALVFYTMLLRVGVFLNDSYTVVNALLAVSDGHLHIVEMRWGPDELAPGLHAVGNRVYGRNYGQVFLALPFLWALQVVVTVADLQVAIVGGWSLLVLALSDQVGALLEQRERYRFAGSVLTLVLFGVNLLVARPLSPGDIPALALQFQTMVAAAGIGVLMYRLVASIHDSRLGTFVGGAIVVGSPVGFWSIGPKRHSLTALATVAVLYCFHRSHAADNPGEAFRFRALAYITVAATAWIHAPEGFILFVALSFADLVTRRRHDLRETVVLAVLFGLALLPFLVTNTLISGNPVEPPRLLSPYRGGETMFFNGQAGQGGGEAAAPVSPKSGGGSGQPLGIALIGGVVLSIAEQFTRTVILNLSGLLDPEKHYRVFVRSGYLPSVMSSRTFRLSMLESMPLLAAALAVPVHLARDREVLSLRTVRESPRHATDAFVAMLVALFVLVYWNRIPIHASFTVRYLHPLYPLGAYVVARLAPIRTVVEEQWQLLTWSYAGLVLLGGQVLITVLLIIPREESESIQLFALVALLSALVLAAWVCVASVRRSDPRAGAVLVSLSVAVTTIFLVVSAVDYYLFGPHALPLTRILFDVLQAA